MSQILENAFDPAQGAEPASWFFTPVSRCGRGMLPALTPATWGAYITDRPVSIAMSHSLAPAASPPRQRRKEARPQELLDAALELFAEKGFAATRSEEVAARAGVAKGTLYLYYPSKEELLKAVISQQLSSEIAAGAEQAEQFDGPIAELLREVLSAWWQRVFDSPGSAVFKLVITEVRNFPEIAEFYLDQVVRPGKQLIGRIIERGIERGEFRPVNVPAAVLSMVLPMVMLCLHKHSLGACVPMEDEVDPKVFIREHIELVLGGLLAADAAPAPARRKRSA
jgi:AcrR family transcriptional regulator